MGCVFLMEQEPTDINTYIHTLSRHDALPIARAAGTTRQRHRRREAAAPGRKRAPHRRRRPRDAGLRARHRPRAARSEEHTSELQSLMRISYAVFCLKKKNDAIFLTTPDHQQTPISQADIHIL